MAPTDRIGKLYTPTAQHLTMKDAVRVSKWKSEAEKTGALAEDPRACASATPRRTPRPCRRGCSLIGRKKRSPRQGSVRQASSQGR